jgi:bacillithiol biosynthesis cysteine-adding enzyme BshC
MQMVENRTVDSACLPFSSIPHTTRLFDDFLHHFDKVSRFYSCHPLAAKWWEEERRYLDYPDDRRKAVADVLERQNREFGAGEKTMENIDRLRKGAAVVVTGQQVGLFGGPLFCLFKAISVAQYAEKCGAVPIFWLASEDHDLAEIDSVSLAAEDHLQRFSVKVPHQEGAPVGAIVFGDEVNAAVEQMESNFGATEVLEWLRTAYCKGENFASAFAKFYAHVLADLGIVFLNPLDPELHRLASPLYRTALEKAPEINQALLERERELESAGYHAQVKVTPSHTLCFYLDQGVRTPIRHDSEGFRIVERSWSRADLLQEAELHPERFSANVLLRPVIEDYLLPTLCYIGGPAEIAYFAQIEVVYRRLASRVTPVMPRIFATLIEPRQSKLLARYGLKLTDAFAGPEKLREVIGAHALPEGVMESFATASQYLDRAVESIQGALGKLDRTLLDAAENAASKMRYQLQGLRDKAARAEARKSAELQRHAEELSSHLYPNKELQERGIGAAYFLFKHGPQVVEELRQRLNSSCLQHQMIELDGPS